MKSFAAAPKSADRAGRAGWIVTWVLLAGLMGGLPTLAFGAKIGEMAELDWQEQALRFWTLRDPAVRWALLGCVSMGVACGLMGSFLVVRKLSLMGDMLSHAVLPGVALGFVWSMTKDPVALFIGATMAGLGSTLLLEAIRRTTRIKDDAAMGMILAGFYGVGILLLVMIQNQPVGDKAGLDKILFGQAAALGPADATLAFIIALVSIGLLVAFYKEFLVTAFDTGFARASGIPGALCSRLLLVLLTFSVVVSLQAAGVVLVSALLITPAATAYLLTDRLHRMLLYAALAGGLAGVLGCFFSFLGPSLPTGPFIVMAATFGFLAAFLISHHHGVIPRLVRLARRRRRVALENTLKAVYLVREREDFQRAEVTLHDLEQQRNLSLQAAEKEAAALVRAGYATWADATAASWTENRGLALTPEGWQRAAEIVRNHRLWELYLTESAAFADDHVHDDAEVIEHLLGEETVRKLEKRLAFPTTDPHGKAIPQTAGVQAERGRG